MSSFTFYWFVSNNHVQPSQKARRLKIQPSTAVKPVAQLQLFVVDEDNQTKIGVPLHHLLSPDSPKTFIFRSFRILPTNMFFTSLGSQTLGPLNWFVSI